MVSDEIKEKINIVDLIGETVQLKKAGVNYRGLCPFHNEKTPSFMVSPTKQIWHCFGCGLGGDIFEFVKQSEGVEFREALEILAARAGIRLERPAAGVSYAPDQKKNLYEINAWAARYYQKVLAESNSAGNAREYVSKRGFKPETLNQWQIGYAPGGFHAFEEFIIKKGYTKTEAVAAGLLVKRDETLRSAQSDNVSFFDRFHERVMFPLFDLHGRVVGFTARTLENGIPSTSSGRPPAAKYINSPETIIYSKSRLIYGLNFAKSEIRKKDEVIVVEGNVDVITCHEFGFTNVVGSSGTAFTSQQLENLKRFTENITFAMDADAAGLSATRRAVELALNLGFNVKIVSIPKGLAKDPDELIRRDSSQWEQAVKTAPNFLDFYFERISATIELQSNTGKKQAVKEILPLLSLLPDSIDRVHYAQKLAGVVSVDPKVIIELLNNQDSGNKNSSAQSPTGISGGRVKITKQELLEARVLGLVLKFSEEIIPETSDLKDSDFTIPANREIFQAITAAIPSGKVVAEQLAAEHPRLATEIDLLVFALENEMALGGTSLELLKKNFLKQFRLERIKRGMRELTAAIKTAEISGQAETVRNLSLEFNNLAAELSKINN